MHHFPITDKNTVQKMKILWLDLNSSYAHSSLALPALHAQMLDNKNIQWDSVSATINEDPDYVTAQIIKHQPSLIAATCWLFTHEALLHILCRAKALLPDSHIVLGGPEFLGDNEYFLRSNPFIDCVLRGEGEEQFPQFCNVWNTPEQWTDIPGICYINNNGTYIDNGIARVMDFEKLHAPEESEFFNWSKPFVQLETTRGCFNTCAFCVSGGEKPVRTLPIETIRKRIHTIHAHGIKNIRVLDRTFNYNSQRAKELLQVFCEFWPDIRFHLEIHPALLTPELKEMLYNLPNGLLHLEAGIQSLHENVLQTSRRHGKLSDALAGLQYLCSLPNMETHADLIAGLPLYHLTEIFDDVKELARYGAGEIQLESLKLLPGTEMRRKASELGIKYAPFPPYEVLQTNEISIEELRTAYQLSRLLDGFYNTPAWQKVTRKLIIEEKDFLYRMLEYLRELDVAEQPLSLERRGIILYTFCKKYYPAYTTEVSIAWIEAGMSLKKQPAEHVRTRHQTPPLSWDVEYGIYNDTLRLCFLPAPNAPEGSGYWFGHASDIQQNRPVFKARSRQ